MSKAQREYFHNNQVNLRKLRHDLASANYIFGLTTTMIEKKPENLAEYIPLLKDAIEQIKEIQQALKIDENTALGINNELVTISKENI